MTAQALELNQRIQQQNAVPIGFPAFVREGFNVKVPCACHRSTVSLCPLFATNTDLAMYKCLAV